MQIILYALIILLLMLYPGDTARFAQEALTIWGTAIVPALFPYMVFSRMLCQRLYALNLPAAPIAAVLGLIGGSPSGAAIIAATSEHQSPRTIHALCALCGTVSPMFILGTLSHWTNNASRCRLLLTIHWITAVLCAGIIWLSEKKHSFPVSSRKGNVQPSFDNPIMQSMDAILQVGGCIICYSVLAGLIGRFFPEDSPLNSLLHVFLEISGGAHAIWQGTFSMNAKGILLSASLGFSGLSILAQNYAFLRTLGISMRRLIFYALLRAISSAAFMACALNFS